MLNSGATRVPNPVDSRHMCHGRRAYTDGVSLSFLCLAGRSSKAVAQMSPDPSCLKAALADYWQANATVLQHLTSDNQFLSPEDQISLRHVSMERHRKPSDCDPRCA